MTPRTFRVPMGVEIAEEQANGAHTLEPRFRAILTEEREREQRIIDESLGRLPILANTDDSVLMSRLTDMIEANPSRFAARFISLERHVQHLIERVDGIAAREHI